MDTALACKGPHAFAKLKSYRHSALLMLYEERLDEREQLTTDFEIQTDPDEHELAGPGHNHVRQQCSRDEAPSGGRLTLALGSDADDRSGDAPSGALDARDSFRNCESQTRRRLTSCLSEDDRLLPFTGWLPQRVELTSTMLDDDDAYGRGSPVGRLARRRAE